MSLFIDLRFALRSLARAKGLTSVRTTVKVPDADDENVVPKPTMTVLRKRPNA